MAQNSIQKYETTIDFHRSILSTLEKWYNVDYSLSRLDNHLSSAEAEDYPDSPLADLNELRTLLTSLLGSSDYTAFKDKVKEFIRI